VRLEGLGQLKNPVTPIGNRTRDIPVRSIVPQPTTLPRAPLIFVIFPKLREPLECACVCVCMREREREKKYILEQKSVFADL
jgi:hypothetical protein